MISESNPIVLIPLNELISSVRNVRKTGRQEDISALAASILAHGLMQNLGVVERGDGKFEVSAGGRRHAALKLLARNGAIAKDFAVPCKPTPPEIAQETSLAENVQRVAMDVMDEVEAFAGLLESGLTGEDIARRFGCTLRHVEQRLALARLSPKIRAAYRKSEINLDGARAFCLGADHAAQERVFKHMAKPITNAQSVRRALTQGRIHDCRGTFATELMQAGYTDTEAAEVLGWDSAKITRIRRKYVDGKKIITAAIRRLEPAQKGQ